MAGNGPPPKPPSRRAGHRGRSSADHWQTFTVKPAKQPRLPSEIDWHPRTRRWWANWGKAPQAATFGITDWSFLLDTALVHHMIWAEGKTQLAGELRLREAKFGVTDQDRARLHMSYSVQPVSETGATDQPPSRERYRNLRSVRLEPPPAS